MDLPVPTVAGRTLHADVLLPAEPPVVRAYLADLRHLERWWPEHRYYRRVRGDGGPGTRYFWIYVAMGTILPGLTRIEANSPELLIYRTAMAGLPIRMRYELRPALPGTALSVEMDCLGLRLPLFARTTGKQLAAALARLTAVFAPEPAAAVVSG